MKCPKCGHENSEKELFCEECDWRLDQKYRASRFGNESRLDKEQLSVYSAFGGLVLGLASLISALLNSGIFAIVFGILGLFIASYSTGVVRAIIAEKKYKTLLIVISAIALLTAVIGLVYGLKVTFM